MQESEQMGTLSDSYYFDIMLSNGWLKRHRMKRAALVTLYGFMHEGKRG